MALDSIISLKWTIKGAYRSVNPICTTWGEAIARLVMAMASSIVVAMGFSQIVCFSASRAFSKGIITYFSRAAIVPLMCGRRRQHPKYPIAHLFIPVIVFEQSVQMSINVFRCALTETSLL